MQHKAAQLKVQACQQAAAQLKECARQQAVEPVSQLFDPVHSLYTNLHHHWKRKVKQYMIILNQGAPDLVYQLKKNCYWQTQRQDEGTKESVIIFSRVEKDLKRMEHLSWFGRKIRSFPGGKLVEWGWGGLVL